MPQLRFPSLLRDEQIPTRVSPLPFPLPRTMIASSSDRPIVVLPQHQDAVLVDNVLVDHCYYAALREEQIIRTKIERLNRQKTATSTCTARLQHHEALLHRPITECELHRRNSSPSIVTMKKKDGQAACVAFYASTTKPSVHRKRRPVSASKSLFRSRSASIMSIKNRYLTNQYVKLTTKMAAKVSKRSDNTNSTLACSHYGKRAC